ncbi:MAG: MFS transporter [Rhodospirillaceae bacterium]|nr:MFS transporter [Rhodospirillaceae bacterium]
MPLAHKYRNVGVLTVCQALFMTGQVMTFILSGLVGFAIADDPALATLPLTAIVIAGMLTTIPASLLMKRIGRRYGFMLAASFGITGVSLSAYAVLTSDFWLFCLGNLIYGVYGGSAQYYRFAAAETVEANFKSRAISWVISGGVAAAVAGPELTKLTHGLVDGVPFLGTYLAIAGLTVCAVLLLTLLDIPSPSLEERATSGRPLAEIATQPAVIVAVIVAMFGYSVMTLLMTATPLAMTGHGYDISDASFVIQWHMLAMFAPAFITGHVIRNFGVVRVMLAGAVMLALAVVAALMGETLVHFWLAMFALGFGWNFTFIGGSTLLTETYEPSERAKVQAMNDFIVFGMVATASLSSGALLHFFDWRAVNMAAIVPITIAGLASLWLHLKRRAAQAAEAA